jgi:hypothetical protein
METKLDKGVPRPSRALGSWVQCETITQIIPIWNPFYVTLEYNPTVLVMTCINVSIWHHQRRLQDFAQSL